MAAFDIIVRESAVNRYVIEAESAEAAEEAWFNNDDIEPAEEITHMYEVEEVRPS